MAELALSPHTARNLRSILEVLRVEFQSVRSVLEIGSGTGQHATGIACAMGQLDWQSSDRQCNHAAILAWLEQASQANVRAPLQLDVLSDAWPTEKYDAVFSANTAHIMSMAAVERLFALVAAVLRGAGKFCLYGPFRQDGKFNAASNEQFDGSLRSQDSAMGIRHLEELDVLGANNGLRRCGLYGMPANNMMAIWTTATTTEESDDHS
jgi:cyclopropane fatty-acyl-phospholipid synthase-like methyltransferase